MLLALFFWLWTSCTCLFDFMCQNCAYSLCNSWLFFPECITNLHMLFCYFFYSSATDMAWYLSWKAAGSWRCCGCGRKGGLIDECFVPLPVSSIYTSYTQMHVVACSHKNSQFRSSYTQCSLSRHHLIERWSPTVVSGDPFKHLLLNALISSLLRLSGPLEWAESVPHNTKEAMCVCVCLRALWHCGMLLGSWWLPWPGVQYCSTAPKHLTFTRPPCWEPAGPQCSPANHGHLEWAQTFISGT